MIEQLASDYSSQPVVFLEYNIDDDRYDDRRLVWWAGYGAGGTVYLPLAMVDSGRLVSQNTGTYAGYQAMVNNALARPAQAEVSATWQRVGDRARFNVTVKNLSGATLSSANNARVWGIVYEDAQVQYTSRFVRGTGSTFITSLANNATDSFTVDTGDLSGDVNWDNLHYIALVDYRPGGSTGAYDMLQAAIAEVPAGVTPTTLTFLVDPADTTIPSVPLTVTGPADLTWNAAPGAVWISVTPLSGSPAVKPQVTVLKGSLVSGWLYSTITFTSPDGKLNQNVAVNAYLGTVHRMYLPVVGK